MNVDLDHKILEIEGVKYKFPSGSINPVSIQFPSNNNIKLVHYYSFMNYYRYIYEIEPKQITINYRGTNYKIAIPWTYFIMTKDLGQSAVYVSSKKCIDFESHRFELYFPNTDESSVCWGSIRTSRSKDEDLIEYHIRLINDFFLSKFTDAMGDFEEILDRHNLTLAKITQLPPDEVCSKIRGEFTLSECFETGDFEEFPDESLIIYKEPVGKTKKITKVSKRKEAV